MNTTPQIMRLVYLSALPALVLFTMWQGPFFLLHLAVASASGLVFEAVVLKLRNKPILPPLQDGSVLLTAMLLVICIPATAPWWLTIVGMFFAVVIAKQLFGGLGHNIFNPAMVGYAVLLVSFPQYLTQWHFIDAVSGPTPLDLRQIGEFTHTTHWQNYQAIAWINIAWVLGGLFLIYKKLIDWRIPVSMLLAVVLTSLVLEFTATNTLPLFWQLGFGATLVGAFYIATDPVTASTTHKGRWIYGALIGVLMICIRQFSAYPDGLAFAILLANIAVPLIDYFTSKP